MPILIRAMTNRADSGERSVRYAKLRPIDNTPLFFATLPANPRVEMDTRIAQGKSSSPLLSRCGDAQRGRRRRKEKEEEEMEEEMIAEWGGGEDEGRRRRGGGGARAG